MPTDADLRQRQSHSLEIKEQLTEIRIREWYEHWAGNVYVAFSGGKDSTVLLHQVRKLYPHVPAVFSDTGLEYPEIREFVKTIENVEWVRPATPFKKVIEQYGYPVISKAVSMGISRARNTKSPLQKKLRLFGGVNPTSGRKQQRSVPKKWHFLMDAPFKISEYCCDVLKKAPFKKYNKVTGRKAMVGTMASDSRQRLLQYFKVGCNSFDQGMSTPLGFWLEKDIWDYINKYKVSYSKIYDKGISKTGCMFCMFGAHLEKLPNRFQRMRIDHPKQYAYCMDKLGCAEVLDYLGIPYN